MHESRMRLHTFGVLFVQFDRLQYANTDILSYSNDSGSRASFPFTNAAAVCNVRAYGHCSNRHDESANSGGDKAKGNAGCAVLLGTNGSGLDRTSGWVVAQPQRVIL